LVAAPGCSAISGFKHVRTLLQPLSFELCKRKQQRLVGKIWSDDGSVKFDWANVLFLKFLYGLFFDLDLDSTRIQVDVMDHTP